jgi:hypothetical protein
VVITNDGAAALHVSSISLTGGDVAHFQIESGGSPVTLTKGSTHTVQVSFDPSTTGAKSANLTIQSDDSDESTVDVSLSGTGIDQEIVVAPGSLSFGSQDVDEGPTVAQTVVITNEGTAALHVSSISLTGGGAAHFQIESGGSPVTLTQGSTHTVQVSFDPSTTGAKSANLTILSDDSDESTVDVSLSGSGNTAPLANAGPDQTVVVSATVTLDGSASSDAENNLPLTFGWTQTGGPEAVLSSNTISRPTFTAPGTPTVLTFTLTITDSLGLSDPTPDSVVITVTKHYIYLPLIIRSS